MKIPAAECVKLLCFLGRLSLPYLSHRHRVRVGLRSNADRVLAEKRLIQGRGTIYADRGFVCGGGV